MVLTKPELIAQLQNEVRILLHLAGKLEPVQLDYRPTPKQRSAIELLKYLTMMGPALVHAAKTGAFDGDAWMAAEQKAAAMTFDQTIAALSAQSDDYANMLGDLSDADMRAEVAPFGTPTTRGAFLVQWVLCGCAAYRTQIFLYLKACGREELTTANLWGGADPQPT